MLSKSEKMIKKRRELLAAYILAGPNSWRRVYPETFYELDSFVTDQELNYIHLVCDILRTVVDGHRRILIEDEINLMYMEIESRASLGKFSEEVLSAIRGRLDLKKGSLQQIETLAMDTESKLPDLVKKPLHIRFRLENTIYLVRLLAYGLFAENDIVLERVAEVFDVVKLQAATMPKEKHDLDNALKFLYRGLIQKNEKGRQGNKHAARQTLAMLREWYPGNEYVNKCIEKIEKYL